MLIQFLNYFKIEEEEKERKPEIFKGLSFNFYENFVSPSHLAVDCISNQGDELSLSDRMRA